MSPAAKRTADAMQSEDLRRLEQQLGEIRLSLAALRAAALDGDPSEIEAGIEQAWSALDVAARIHRRAYARELHRYAERKLFADRWAEGKVRVIPGGAR